MFLNMREKKKIKKGLGWVEIGWTRVWRRKMWGPFLLGLGCLLRYRARLPPAIVGPSVL